MSRNYAVSTFALLLVLSACGQSQPISTAAPTAVSIEVNEEDGQYLGPTTTVPAPTNPTVPQLDPPTKAPDSKQNLNERHSSPLSQLCWINREVSRRFVDFVSLDEDVQQAAIDDSNRWLESDGMKLADELELLESKLPVEVQPLARLMAGWFREAVASAESEPGVPALYVFYESDDPGFDRIANEYAKVANESCIQAV